MVLALFNFGVGVKDIINLQNRNNFDKAWIKHQVLPQKESNNHILHEIEFMNVKQNNINKKRKEWSLMLKIELHQHDCSKWIWWFSYAIERTIHPKGKTLKITDIQIHDCQSMILILIQIKIKQRKCVNKHHTTTSFPLDSNQDTVTFTQVTRNNNPSASHSWQWQMPAGGTEKGVVPCALPVFHIW